MLAGSKTTKKKKQRGPGFLRAVRRAGVEARRRALPLASVAALCAAAALVMGSAYAPFTGSDGNSPNQFAADTLDPPTSVTADHSAATQVDVAWTATVDAYASGYNIYRSTTSGSGYTYRDTVAGRATVSYTDDLCEAVPATPAFVDVGDTDIFSSAVTSMALLVPGGTTAGDLLVAHIAVDGSDPTFSTPAGWTELIDATSGGFSEVSMGVWYRVAGASEPSDYTFAWSRSDDAIGGLVRYSGIDGADPIQSSSIATGWSDTATAPSVTTTDANTMILRIMASDGDNVPGSGGYPAGHDGRYSIETDGEGSDVSGALADTLQASAGATGTAGFSLSFSDNWVAATVALNPFAPSYYYVLEAYYSGWTSSYSEESVLLP